MTKLDKPLRREVQIGDKAYTGFSRHTCKNDSQNLIYFCKS